MIGVEAECRAMGLITAQTEELSHLGMTVGAAHPFGGCLPGELGGLRGVDEGGSASRSACTFTPLLTGVSVVVIFFLLIWSVLE